MNSLKRIFRTFWLALKAFNWRVLILPLVLWAIGCPYKFALPAVFVTTFFLEDPKAKATEVFGWLFVGWVFLGTSLGYSFGTVMLVAIAVVATLFVICFLRALFDEAVTAFMTALKGESGNGISISGPCSICGRNDGGHSVACINHRTRLQAASLTTV